ncbi:MAG: dgoA protein, partial [Planctomycetes bacterium]|nr:dgoA protein [Planctomycetota bacterium]
MNMYTRRSFLKRAGISAVGLGLPAMTARALRAAGVGPSSDQFRVERIDRVTVKVPYRPAPQRAMDRELPHWRWMEIFEITLRSGAVGLGETSAFYTWGRSTEEEASKVMHKNAVDLMWDDRLGAGLQIALFDAVARTAGVPIHRLLGRQVYETTPLSWWNIDMEADDLAAECKEAYKQGYMSLKTKGRPWFDIYEQVEKSAKGVPPEFKIDMDFNSTLLTAEKGMKIIKDLEAYPQVDIY